MKKWYLKTVIENVENIYSKIYNIKIEKYLRLFENRQDIFLKTEKIFEDKNIDVGNLDSR